MKISQSCIDYFLFILNYRPYVQLLDGVWLMLKRRIKDLSGLKVGKLKIDRFVGTDDMDRALWECICDCGSVVIRKSRILSDALKNKKASHCGCSNPAKTHGLTKDNKNLYWVWSSMIQRCENSNNKDFHNYGGRMISICDEWRRDFSNFYNWAKKTGYRRGVTIERVDVNGNYEPSNCTWIKNERQALNCRHSLIVEYKGESKHISDWARETGISYNTLKARLFFYKWDVERAMTEFPVVGKNQYA